MRIYFVGVSAGRIFLAIIISGQVRVCRPRSCMAFCPNFRNPLAERLCPYRYRHDVELIAIFGPAELHSCIMEEE